MSAVVRLRGLPYRATPDEVVEWLGAGGVSVSPDCCFMQKGTDGRPTGQCFVRLDSPDNAAAVTAMDRKSFGTRYVEVYPSTEEELNKPYQNPGSGPSGGFTPAPGGAPRGVGGAGFDGHVVRMRGLPFQATELDIASFLTGINIAPQGIHLVLGGDSRPTGEAFVELQGPMDVQNALGKDRERLGHRYVEIFRSSQSEMTGGAPPVQDWSGGGSWGGAGGGSWGGAGGGGGAWGAVQVATVGFTPYGGGGGGGGAGMRGGGGGGGNNAGQTEKPGDWYCSQCNFLCFASRSSCKNCGANRS